MQRRVVGLVVACWMGACSRPPVDASPQALEAPPPAADPGPAAAAPRTALCVLALQRDGSVTAVELREKAIAFRGPVTRETLPALRAGAVLEPVAAPHVHAGAAAPSHTLRVTHPDHPTLLLDVDLGAPGEGGGDVADRWDNGSVVVRAPSYGPGTRFVLSRHGSTAAVTQLGVTP